MPFLEDILSKQVGEASFIDASTTTMRSKDTVNFIVRGICTFHFGYHRLGQASEQHGYRLVQLCYKEC